MHFLIVSDINNIKEKKITHYSLDKGLNLGIGIKNNGCKVDYVVSTDCYEENGIKYINYLNLNEEKINDYDYVIIIREGLLEEIFKIFVELKKVFFSPNKKTRIIIKSDSCTWAIAKEFRKYVSNEININASTNSIIKWVNNNIDVICVQNKEFFENGLNLGIDKSKMLITNMAIPFVEIDYESIENPYKSDYSYCKNKKKLTSGDSFLPYYYEKNIEKIDELINKKRIKLIYVGRIKTDGGKIIYLLRDIINELGDNYELHIFPGSFIIKNDKTNIIESFSANNSNHLEIMRDKIFYDCKNVFIHCPFEHKNIQNYLWHADIGIDFSSSRPYDKKADAGNAKLLEYCYMGLPVVTEKNVNNSYLVENCSNGILLDGIATVKEYVEAIHILSNEISIDRKMASNITIQNENWNLRAKQFIDDLKLKFK